MKINPKEIKITKKEKYGQIERKIKENCTRSVFPNCEKDKGKLYYVMSIHEKYEVCIINGLTVKL